MLGVSLNFGGSTGITLKVLSTNRDDKSALEVVKAPLPKSQRRLLQLVDAGDQLSLHVVRR